MSAGRRIRWAQLRIGLATSLAVTAAAVLIFFIDDVRDAVEDRYTLYFHTFTTQALRPQAPVWLAGQPVGRIRRLRFEPPTGAAGERLRVELSIRAKAQPFITEGAAAQVITAGVLGEAVVNILPASEPGQPLADRSELPTAAELDPFKVTRRLQTVYDSVPGVAERWRELLARLRDGRGTLPRLLRRPEDIVELQRNLDALAAVFDTVRTAAGRVAGLLRDREVRAALDRLGPRLTRLAEQWRGAGSVGGFARDTAIAARLEAVSRNLGRVVGRLESGRGTLGRLLQDRALARELEKTREMLRELRAGLAGGGVP
jgi:phospholipid/cholesterol/gamma-HCH transport system substrate-binding protein